MEGRFKFSVPPPSSPLNQPHLLPPFRTPVPLYDRKNRIYASLSGQPSGTSYRNAANRSYFRIAEEGEDANFHQSCSVHRRGGFPALNVGLSYGMGQQEPAHLKNGAYSHMLERLVQDPAIQQVAAFGSCECPPPPYLELW